MVAITQFIVAGLMTAAVQALPQPQAGTPAPPAPAASDKDAADQAKAKLFQTLLTVPTAVKRFQTLITQKVNGETKLLEGDDLKKQIVFPFTPPPVANQTAGGAAVAANIDSFPILTGLGISTTLGFLQPCGINTPHVHPRATEFLTVVDGKNVKFGYVLENGLVSGKNNPEVAGSLQQFEGTVFPQGSIHFQFNDNCEQAVFVAALNNEDPGTNQVAQGFFNLNSQVINATLGFPKEINGKNIDEFKSTIPPNLAQDVQVCLARCNKKN
ncbi:RmlC-like cupin [Phaeosphaeriaceae sp. SRC1lsM3a]|nr:RmlC-like cupin [Stagonospora sp. SRC1lsM3a]